ncbi:gamma-glutamyltransferase family protein [Thalassospira sp. TSL5-1]|uniref:gamma-glutamyltransferase family protein n=1 Tax=Thalassospira sp. TSL5-1 TaxID=1544451 RepID=UPI00093AB5BC|nr:gamma-glutamyltransferase [Thalassospira sp. TSL5-1]OKH86762.1 gamma-glutamyltransferase [Thalassospira sp. TSL5-1]
MDSFSNSQIIRKPATKSANGGIVAAQHKKGAAVGAAILANGGDAVDAAVATSFAMGAVEPWMSGPAGGGAMMIYRAKENRAYTVYFGMRSPSGLNPADYPLSGNGRAGDLFPWPHVKDDRNQIGATSIAVPGTVAGMEAAHEKFGKLSWRDLLSPAAQLADEGLHVDWYAALIIAASTRDLAKNPTAAKTFLEDGQWPTIAGWTALSDKRIDLSILAGTLRRLGEKGAREFYEGDLAHEMIADIKDAGGCLSMDDLRNYRAEIQCPLKVDYRQGKVFMPPQFTAGENLAECLTLLGESAFAGQRPGPDAYVAYAAALRKTYARRLTEMGDINDDRAPTCTTHFSVVDREGNMVAVTQTLLSIFGSKVVLPQSGLLMNNGILWFDPEKDKPNSLAPSKRCLMNVCPALGEIEGRRFAIGASGGRKILPAVLQLTSFMTDFGMSLEEAMHQQRIDSSGGDTVIADQSLPEDVLAALQKEYPTKTTRRMPFPYAFACPAGVARDGNINSGATEIMSPWGDAVAEKA